MPRIITPKGNNFLRHEYKLRFFSLLFFGSSVVLMIHISLSVSSYILLNAHENTHINQDDAAQIEANQKFEYFIKTLDDADKLSRSVIVNKNDTYIEIFEKINSHKSFDVEINVFEIFFNKDQTEITIRGVSETRQSLVEFAERMRNDSSFKDFEIPFETLTRQRDIPFDVTFTYYEN